MADKILAENAEENDGEEAVISMVDYLREEQELQDDANAVLGDSDENQCTFPLGYRPRQALYACSTCETKDKVPAGVCLACSYACHEGHLLHELYTKRNFRCDCGNNKYEDVKCKLYPKKSDYNVENVYNQNFTGLYCVCERPYPDPEDEIEDEMIQCLMCEDWYHGRHLGDCKTSTDYAEMICLTCMNKHDFLWAYTVNSEETMAVESDKGDKDVDAEQADASDGNGTTSSKDTPRKGTKRKADGQACDTNSNIADQCLLADLRKREITVKASATFWPDNFRSKLCTCSSCKQLYRDQCVEYLIDEADTVKAYEARGSNKPGQSSQHDREQQALGSMDRVQQIEIVQGFNDMKSALNDYLKQFAENGKVVTAEDIREFFTQMEQRKRQKTDSAPPYMCK